MIAVYQHLHTDGANTVEVLVTGPGILAPGADATGLIHAAFLDAAEVAGDAAVGESRRSYSPPEIAAGWGLEVTGGPGWTRIDVLQASKVFWAVEERTAPHNIPGAFGHPAPFGTTGRFGGYFHPGTPGKHRLPAQEAALLKVFGRVVDSRVKTLLEGA